MTALQGLSLLSRMVSGLVPELLVVSVFVEVVGLCSGQKLATRCVCPEVSWEVEAKVSCCLGPAPPLGVSYSVVCRWLLLVLGLEVPGEPELQAEATALLLSSGLFSKTYGTC